MGYSANAELQDFFDPEPTIRACRRITKRAVKAIEDGARKRSPVAKPPPGVGATEFAGMRGRSPGTLKESWYSGDVDQSRGPNGVARFSAEAATDDPIAPHVEWPTAPHIIRPSLKRAPASVTVTGKPRRMGSDPMARLRYVDASGRVRFAAEVHHPGTQGQHMMRDSLAEVDGTWEARIGDEELAIWAREQKALIQP